MARKEHPGTGNQIIQSKDTFLPSKTDRQKKIMNSIVNTSIILMSTMMGEFTKTIMNTTGAMASGMAAELGGKKDVEKINKEFKKKLPEADEKIKAMISDVRKEVYAQLGQKSKEIEPLLSDPVFDIGPKIIEKYDFKLPKLTEELNDHALAQYTRLLVNEDPSFAKMFNALISWINTMPKFPEKTNEK